MDSGIRQLVWNGSIPLEIHINDPENILTCTNNPISLPFYIMARRLLYFPMLVNEIKRHFGSISRTAETVKKDFLGLSESSFSDSTLSFESSKSSQTQQQQQQQNWWFTCKFNESDCLLPLHLPIGLIYDLLMNSGTVLLPWKLEFHISFDNPNKENSVSVLNQNVLLLDESSLTSFYFSSLKESDHLRSGSAKNVMNLSRAEQLQLWESLKSGECEKFWRINQKLITTSTNSSFKSVPIKFWIFENQKLTRFQFPIHEISWTLKQILLSEFSDLFIERIENVCLHGISLPLNTKIEELNYNWNYADNFINMTIKLK